jgi:hypothetical protein
LLDAQRRHIDENEIALVLDDKRFAIVGKRKIDGSAGKLDLLSRRTENLVGGYDDSTVRLDADWQSIEIVLPTAASRHQLQASPKRHQTENRGSAFDLHRDALLEFVMGPRRTRSVAT